MNKLVSAFAIGGIFGLGIAVSGMINPAKVLNFFDVAGTWDPSLIFVMGGGLVTAFIGYRLIFGRLKAPVFESCVRSAGAGQDRPSAGRRRRDVRHRLGHCRLLSGRRDPGARPRPCGNADLRRGDGCRYRSRASRQDPASRCFACLRRLRIGEELPKRARVARQAQFAAASRGQTLRGPYGIPPDHRRLFGLGPDHARRGRGDQGRRLQERHLQPARQRAARPAVAPTASRRRSRPPVSNSASSRSSAARSPATTSPTRPRRSTSWKARSSPIAAPARAAPTSMLMAQQGKG